MAQEGLFSGDVTAPLHEEARGGAGAYPEYANRSGGPHSFPENGVIFSQVEVITRPSETSAALGGFLLTGTGKLVT